MDSVVVKQIKSSETYEWILEKHYAHRIPSISYAFGLFKNNELIGIVTYGKNPSSTLSCGVCGVEYSKYVIELNRLCINDGCLKNAASILVGRSLKMLPTSIVVSFADISMNHIGYVYQATNFYYTGLSAKRTDWAIEGFENLHGVTIADMSRGIENRSKYMKEKYGDKFYLKERSRKHRYVIFCGTKREKKTFLNHLKYDIVEYPKGNTLKYDASHICTTQTTLEI